VGLVPSPSGECLQDNTNLDMPDIRPDVERILGTLYQIAFASEI